MAKNTWIKLLSKWAGTSFESSSTKTPEFTSFARDYKKMIKAVTEESGFELVNYSVGHFYISGFLQHTETGKLVYFSTSDVRDSEEWYQNILIRTAADLKDFTGGHNHYTHLSKMGESIQQLHRL